MSVAQLPSRTLVISFRVNHELRAVFLTDINDFQMMNGVYATYFEGTIPPARSTVAVSNLAAGAAVEIDFIAVR